MTVDWVDWFKQRRLLEGSGYLPPAGVDAAYYEQLGESAQAA